MSVRGISHYGYAVSVPVFDDNVYILDGYSTFMYTTGVLPPDQEFTLANAQPFTIEPTTQPVSKDIPDITVFFKESVQVAAGAKILYTPKKDHFDRFDYPKVIYIERQGCLKDCLIPLFPEVQEQRVTLNFYTSGYGMQLESGGEYKLVLPAHSFGDISGNFLSSALKPDYTLIVNADVQGPDFLDWYPMDGAVDVPPWTTLTLTFSEAVQRGRGGLALLPFTFVACICHQYTKPLYASDPVLQKHLKSVGNSVVLQVLGFADALAVKG